MCLYDKQQIFWSISCHGSSHYFEIGSDFAQLQVHFANEKVLESCLTKSRNFKIIFCCVDGISSFYL